MLRSLAHSRKQLYWKPLCLLILQDLLNCSFHFWTQKDILKSIYIYIYIFHSYWWTEFISNSEMRTILRASFPYFRLSVFTKPSGTLIVSESVTFLTGLKWVWLGAADLSCVCKLYTLDSDWLSLSNSRQSCSLGLFPHVVSWGGVINFPSSSVQFMPPKTKNLITVVSMFVFVIIKCASVLTPRVTW